MQSGVLFALVAGLVATAWLLEKERKNAMAELEAALEETQEVVQGLQRVVQQKEQIIAEQGSVIQKGELGTELGKKVVFFDAEARRFLTPDDLAPERAAGYARRSLLRVPDEFSVDRILRHLEDPAYRPQPGPGDYHLEWPPQAIPSNLTRPLDYVVPGPPGP